MHVFLVSPNFRMFHNHPACGYSPHDNTDYVVYTMNSSERIAWSILHGTDKIQLYLKTNRIKRTEHTNAKSIQRVGR